MAKLMHTDLVAEDETFSFTMHPRACPKVDKSTERHTHAVVEARLYREGDATQGLNAVDLTSECP